MDQADQAEISGLTFFQPHPQLGRTGHSQIPTGVVRVGISIDWFRPTAVDHRIEKQPFNAYVLRQGGCPLAGTRQSNGFRRSAYEPVIHD